MKFRGSFKKRGIIKNDASLQVAILRSATIGGIDLRTLQAV
jgi:hypothetical protein